MSIYGQWSQEEVINHLNTIYKNETHIKNVYIQSSQLMTGMVEHLPKEIKRQLQNVNSILDWGCGIGGGTDVIGRLINKKVTGLDISTSAIKKAKELFPEYEFISEKLNKKFDVIVNSNCLEHFNTPEEILKEHIHYATKYYIILAPYKGRIVNKIGDHISTLNGRTFPEKIGTLERIHFDTFLIYPGWKADEKQMLIIYENKSEVKNE